MSEDALRPPAEPALTSVLLRLGRVSNLPTVWTNLLAGIVLAGATIEPEPAIILALSMSLFYLGGMYLNDAFDREIDARERPERPIPSGVISAATVFGLGYGMIAVALALLAYLGLGGESGQGWWPLLAGLVLGGSIVFYDWKHKENPISPLIMGLCRMLVYITAGFAVAAQPEPALYLGAVVLLCYLIGLTYAAKQENLNRIANLWPLLFLAVPLVVLLPLALGSVTGIVLWLALLLWIVYALSYLVLPSRIMVPRAVVSLLAGICLVDAVLMASHGAPLGAWIAVAAFPLTLALQRWIPGT